jgi:hypothetical protein
VTSRASRRRPASASCAALALAASFLLHCSPRQATREVVIARIGGEPAAAAQELPAAATLKLGTRTRNALRGAGATVFEVEVDGHALHLEFSTALLATADATGGASFSVEHRAGAEGRWAEIFRSATTAGEAAWSDHRTALPSAALHRLRFSATTQPAEASGLEPVWGSVSFRAPAGASQRRRPNVLLIVLDTLGAAFLGDWGGAPDASPHIDAFIDQGFAFRRAYAQYGNTLVSHASLFSALHPIRHRVYPGLPGRPLAESLVAPRARSSARTSASPSASTPTTTARSAWRSRWRAARRGPSGAPRAGSPRLAPDSASSSSCTPTRCTRPICRATTHRGASPRRSRLATPA